MSGLPLDDERAEINTNQEFIAWAHATVAAQMRKGREKGWHGWHDPKLCPTERLAQFGQDARFRGDLASAATYLLMIEWRNRRDTE